MFCGTCRVGLASKAKFHPRFVLYLLLFSIKIETFLFFFCPKMSDWINLFSWTIDYQVRCVYPWLFSQEGFKSFCSSFPSWRESFLRSCWYVCLKLYVHKDRFFWVLNSSVLNLVSFYAISFGFWLLGALVLQLLMLREAFSLNGGRSSGIYLLLEPMRSTRRSLLLTSRFVWECLSAWLVDYCSLQKPMIFIIRFSYIHCFNT